MKGIQPLAPSVEVDYPSEDGEPMAETGFHALLLVLLHTMLREWYRGRSDVYVAADMFLYYQEGDPTKRRTPDVMVIKEVEGTHERNSFKLWEERAVPCVVIELTSEKTAAEDQGPKKELYERIGVREYFLFDPLGDYLPTPLIGYRLIGVSANGSDEVSHRYEQLSPAADGGVPSAELGLRFVPDGTNLLLFNSATGEQLPTPADAYAQVRELEGQAEEAREQADEADRRARKAEQTLEDERRQRERLEAQLARLRALLPADALPPEENAP